jgi:hypothetical protein
MDCDRIARELEKLAGIAGRKVSGNRCHYLALDVRRHFRDFEDAGLAYDTSLGFPEREGFRNGWTFPCRPYDLENDRPFRILEIPLAVMDTTLMEYRKLTAEEGWEACRKVLDTLRETGGGAALLWHNGRSGAWQDVYHRVLDYIREHGGAGVAAEQLALWWSGPSREAEGDS